MAESMVDAYKKKQPSCFHQLAETISTPHREELRDFHCVLAPSTGDM